MSQGEPNPDDGNPFAAPRESSLDDAEDRRASSPWSKHPPRGSAQFSLKMMFGLTGGLAALLAILTALRMEVVDIVAALIGTSLAALMAIVLVTLTWSLTGRPRRRR